MYRQLRRKFASSVSLIENEEDFLYANWLKVPNTEDESVGTISSELFDTSFITCKFKQPFSIEHLFSLGDSTLYPEDLSYLFGKIATNPVFFQLLYVPTRILNYSDLDHKKSSNSYREVVFRLKDTIQQEIEVQFKSSKPHGYIFKLPEPKINDHLNNLKPKVLKIDLLNQNDFVKNGDQTLIKRIDVTNFGKEEIVNINIDALPKKPILYKINVPGMGKYKSKTYRLKIPVQSQVKVSKFKEIKSIKSSNNTTAYRFNLTDADIKSLSIDFDSVSNSPKLKESFSDNKANNDIIKQLLKKSFKVKWKSPEDSGINLSKLEDDEAKYLAENNRAFLASEPGLNKTKVTMAALQFLLTKKVISSALVIAPSYNIGCKSENYLTLNNSGWLDTIKKYLPGISATVIKGDEKERLQNWNDLSQIHLVSPIIFGQDIENEMFDIEQLNRYDCLIVDEVQEIVEGRKILGLKKINPQIFWALSSQVNGDLPDKINAVMDENYSIKQVKFSRISDKIDERAAYKFEEFWLEPDDKQKVDYKDTITECRKELKRILESGNPLRYQANIFMLLHKLFQVQNFRGNLNISPKAELLLHHLKSIQENGRQAIIVSQYDQQGIKKIERLFDANDVSYVSVSTGYSTDQVQKSVSLFKSNKNVTAFLTNDKVTKINFGNYFVPYVISFDSWWTPDLIYRTSNLFETKDDNSSRQNVNIFSYKMIGTLDEQIKQLLVKKEFYQNDLVNFMTSNALNDLITIDEWVKMFGLPIDDDEQEYKNLYESTSEWLYNASIADVRETLSAFFSAIGYSNMKFQENEKSFSIDMTGQAESRGKVNFLFCRFLSGELISIDSVQKILADHQPKNNSNLFIITNGKFSDECSGLNNNNLTLIDLEKLVKYLLVLNIIQLPVKHSSS